VLTRVLLTYFAKTTVFILLVACGISYLVLGEATAMAVLATGLVVALDGAALIWVVGVLLDPQGSSAAKATTVVILMGKLAAVGGLLYWLHAAKGMDELGMLIGIGAGMAGLVLGANQGSASPEGRQAIAQAEKEIEEEMGDNEEDSQ
jgi:hypothetical protein